MSCGEPGGRGGRGGTKRGGRGGMQGGGRGSGSGGGAGGGHSFQLVCNMCHKFHPGNPQGDSCFHRNLDAEQEKLDTLKQQKQAASERAKDRQEQKLYQQVQFITNKTGDECLLSAARWDPTHTIHPSSYSTICLNVRQSYEYLNGAAVDSASPIDIQNDEDQVRLTCGPSVFLEGIIPGAAEVPASECSFPTIDIYSKQVVFKTKGKGILHKRATSK
eukprot:2182407-Rhodomonas_salina.1